MSDVRDALRDLCDACDGLDLAIRTSLGGKPSPQRYGVPFGAMNDVNRCSAAARAAIAALSALPAAPPGSRETALREAKNALDDAFRQTGFAYLKQASAALALPAQEAPGEYERAIEDAAKVADEYARRMIISADRRATMGKDSAVAESKSDAGESIAAAIRALKPGA